MRFSKYLFLALLFLLVNSVTGVDSVNVNTQKYVPGELIVKFKETATINLNENNIGISSIDSLGRRNNLRSMEPLIKKRDKENNLKIMSLTYSAKEKSELDRLYVLRFQNDVDIEQLISEYKNNPLVEYAEPNYIIKSAFTPSDTSFSQQWGLSKISAEIAWDTIKGNGSIIIAVVDTGIDWNSNELKNNIWNNTDEPCAGGTDADSNNYANDCRGWDFVNNDNNPNDDNSHGTQMSSIIGAQNDGNGIVGVCMNCTLMPVKVLNSLGTGTTANLAAGIEYAKNNSANVISLSLGTSCNTFPQAVNDAVIAAHKSGIVVIAAASNDNANCKQMWNNPNVIVVTATDRNDKKTSFSNYGGWWKHTSNTGAWVNVAAPGKDILSTTTSNLSAIGSGTSQSTAFVSGLAGLLFSANSTLTSNQIKMLIQSTTDALSAGENRYYLGIGRINASRAIQNANASPLFAFLNHSELDGKLFQNSILINGTANGTNFVNYTIEVRNATWPNNIYGMFDLINTSNAAVNYGLLANWTPTESGRYIIRLKTTNTNGFQSIDQTLVTVKNDTLCGDITGDTTLSSNVVYNSGNTCFNIKSNNIIFDCGGKSIAGFIDQGLLNAPNLYGINITDRNNITIKNCYVEGFGKNLYILNTNSSHFFNVSTASSFSASVYMKLSSSNNFTNLTGTTTKQVSDTTIQDSAITIFLSNLNNFTTIKGFYGSRGIEINGTGNNFKNISTTGENVDGGQEGFKIIGDNYTLEGGTIFLNELNGITIIGNYNKLNNLTIYNNTFAGISVTGNYTTLENVSSSENAGLFGGVYLSSQGHNRVINITTYNNSQNGFTISGTNNTVDIVESFDNPTGMTIASENSTLTNLNSYRNRGAGISVSGINNTISGGTSFNNTNGGIEISASMNNISNMNVYNNNLGGSSSSGGIYATSNFTLTNNTIYNNSNSGLYLSTDALGINITNNNIFGNGVRQIFSSYGLNISGNFWGRNSPKYFIEGTDSNANSVNDTSPYGQLYGWINTSRDFDGVTTNFESLLTSNSNFSSLSNITIENSSAGKIVFTNNISFVRDFELRSFITIGNNSAQIKSLQIKNVSGNLPLANNSFNITANITLYSISLNNPRVFVDYGDTGSFNVCSECVILSTIGSTIKNITFNVSSFSTYRLEDDVTSPSFSNTSQSSSNPPIGTSVSLSAFWTDNVNLNSAVLETNETGTFQNKTKYNSPFSFTSSSQWANFTWSNSTISAGAAIGWKIHANDSSGNSNVTQALSFTIGPDTVAPTSTLTSPQNSFATNSSSISFQCGGDDNYQLKNVTLFTNTSGTFSAAGNYSLSGNSSSSTFNVTGISEGAYLWNCRFFDTNENSAFASANRTFIVDTSIPNISFISPTLQNGTATNSQNLIINVSHTEANPANITFLIDGTTRFLGSYSGGFTNKTFSVSAGTHNFSVKINDTAGNEKQTETRFITVDLTAPSVVSKTLSSSLLLSGDHLNLQGVVSKSSMSRMRVNITGPNFSNLTEVSFTGSGYSLNFNTSLLSEGEYNVTLVANDSANNDLAERLGGFNISTPVTFAANIMDNGGNLLNINKMSFFYAGTTNLRTDFNETTSTSFSLPKGMFDIALETAGFNITFLNTNASVNLQNNITVDYNVPTQTPPSGISKFAKVIAASYPFSLTGVNLTIPYDDTGLDESNLKMMRCAQWNTTAQTCSGSWADVTSNTTFNTSSNVATVSVGNLSGYGVGSSGSSGSSGGSSGGGGGGGGGFSRSRMATPVIDNSYLGNLEITPVLTTPELPSTPFKEIKPDTEINIPLATGSFAKEVNKNSKNNILWISILAIIVLLILLKKEYLQKYFLRRKR